MVAGTIVALLEGMQAGDMEEVAATANQMCPTDLRGPEHTPTGRHRAAYYPVTIPHLPHSFSIRSGSTTISSSCPSSTNSTSHINSTSKLLLLPQLQ